MGQVGDSFVLDMAEWLRVVAVRRVRFVRGTAWNRTSCEVEPHALDGLMGHPAPLKRGFEEVIMVDVLIEEMSESD
jgi:hypothetical protein